METTKTTPAVRYYVARTNGRLQVANSLSEADAYATHLYKDCGVIAPLVVAAVDADTARLKAAACYARRITTRQARRP